jgi:replicative DNA helicase
LTQRVSSDAHIDYHSRIIVQKYVLRTIIKVCDHMRAHCYHSDPDIFDMMDYNDKMMAKIKHDIDIDNAMNESAADELKRKMNRIMSGQASGVPMGHSEFDEWCGGFQERELIIIAARPGMGKNDYCN